jgi:hypothetical protein
VPLSSPREDLQSAAQLPLLHSLHWRAGTDSKYTVHRVHTYTLWIAQYSTYTYIMDRTVQYLHIHHGSHSTVLTHTLWIVQYSTYTVCMVRYRAVRCGNVYPIQNRTVRVSTAQHHSTVRSRLARLEQGELSDNLPLQDDTAELSAQRQNSMNCFPD